MMTGIATPTVEPSEGRMDADANGASPVNGVGSCPTGAASGSANWKIGNAGGGGSSGVTMSTSGSATAEGIAPGMAASIATEISAAAVRARITDTHEWLPACATTASSMHNG